MAILNLPNDNDNNDTVSANINGDNKIVFLDDSYMQHLMSVFHTQLRMLLGLSPSSSSTISNSYPVIFHFLPCPINGLTLWELDASIRLRIIYFVKESTKTLKGLSKLVSKMKHMVVKESVKHNVDIAVMHLKSVGAYLEVYIIIIFIIIIIIIYCY